MLAIIHCIKLSGWMLYQHIPESTGTAGYVQYASRVSRLHQCLAGNALLKTGRQPAPESGNMLAVVLICVLGTMILFRKFHLLCFGNLI
jgi:hypothetical protein